GGRRRSGHTVAGRHCRCCRGRVAALRRDDPPPAALAREGLAADSTGEARLMFPSEFEYFAPATIDEALALLSRYGDDAKVLAGGQSLLPMMKLRIASPRYLIDINRVDSLKGLRVSGGRLVMGALCRHAEIAASPIVKEHLPLMTDAAQQTA